MKKDFKTSSGYTMIGICTQWMLDKSEMTDSEMKVYLKILRNSFGFKKRWCYLKYDDFSMRRATVKKTIDSLVEKKIISYKNTYNPENGNRSMNEYKILRPNNYIKHFAFIGKDEAKEEEQKTEDEKGWWNTDDK